MKRAVLMMLVLLTLCAGCGDPNGTSGITDTLASVAGEAGRLDDLSGLGDEYFPQAGNAGYDVLHYDIALDCDPADGSLAGTTIVEAKALAELDEFHLDLVGLQVEDVSVDGAPADYRRLGQELIIECPETLSSGSGFSVTVTYSGTPQRMRSADGYRVGWQHSGDTIFTLDEPEGAATWYPLNDHPSDKATYSFHLTVPLPYTAVANGLLKGTEDAGSERTFWWEMEQPMANYLASVVVGELVLQETVSPAGVPIRNYFTPEVAESARVAFEITGEVLDHFSQLFGPYPFDVYGVVVPDATTEGAAMENQTISLFGRDTLEGSMGRRLFREMILSHELAHQWFGNSVTLDNWKDIWLNEGFATYASWLWFEHKDGDEGIDMWVQDAFDYLKSKGAAAPGDPGVDDLFGGFVYERGGLTLHALRIAVGDDLFFGILRDWVARNAYDTVNTTDFIGLVKEATAGLDGFDADALFDTWLYQPDLPPAAQIGL